MPSKTGTVIPKDYVEVTEEEFVEIEFDMIGIRCMEHTVFDRLFLIYKEYEGKGYYILTKNKQLAKLSSHRKVLRRG